MGLRFLGFSLLIGSLLATGRRPPSERPVRYCLSYVGGADSIRLAQSIELALTGDSGIARSTAFPLDPRHTPGLLARIGKWSRRDDGEVSITFGGEQWRYIYEVRVTDRSMSGHVRLQTDLHLDSAKVWRVTGRRCARTKGEDAMRIQPYE